MKRITILILTAVMALCSCSEELDNNYGKIEDVTNVTVKEFLAKPVAADPWYKIDGKIIKMEDAQAGVFYLEDETGTLYVSGVSKDDYNKGFQMRSNPMNFNTLGIKEGDVITIVGIRKMTDNFPAMGGPAYYISHKAGETDNGNGDGGNGDNGGEVVPPVPGETTCEYVWAELPAIQDADKNGINDSNSNFYYAHHWCAGGEKVKGVTARNFTTCFSKDDHCPIWVAAPRHAMYVGGGRHDAYKPDPKIPASIQYRSKSGGAGCNKGHLLGSHERTRTTATNHQVFYYSNIAPQNGSTYNTGGGAWNNLEGVIDGFDCADTLYQVVGCYFKDWTSKSGVSARAKKISYGGRSDVSWPTMMYIAVLRTKKGDTGKSVLECSRDELKCVAFCISHNEAKGHRPDRNDMMSISELEKLTGFTYFVNVPNAPKDTFNPSDWNIR